MSIYTHIIIFKHYNNLSIFVSMNGSPVGVDSIERIVSAINIRADAVILFAEWVRYHPASEGRGVKPCSVVAVRYAEVRFLVFLAGEMVP